MLLESIKRKPTVHTVWLVQRIINDPKLEKKNIYIEVLENILNDKIVDEAIKYEISTFFQ